MATDYDAPRKTEEDQSEESIEELKARRHDKNSGKVDEDETEAAESFELPGADLSHEELAVEVMPRLHLSLALDFRTRPRPFLPVRGGRFVVCAPRSTSGVPVRRRAAEASRV